LSYGFVGFGDGALSTLLDEYKGVIGMKSLAKDCGSSQIASRQNIYQSSRITTYLSFLGFVEMLA